MKKSNRIKDYLKTIPFFMGMYNVYFKLRFGRRQKRKQRYFIAENEELFRKFTETLNSNDIVFWLEFGTLLGFYREHDFIKHDFDLDVGVRLYDAAKVRKCLTENGFKLVRDFHAKDGGMEESYRYLHTTIDLFYFRVDASNPSIQYCNMFKSPVFPVKKQHLNKMLTMTVKRKNVPNNGFERAVFKGYDIYIPKKTDEHLCAHYGKNFMIPDPTFSHDNDIDNTVYYTLEENPGTGVFHELPL